MLLTFKHPAFREEQEWRLVQHFPDSKRVKGLQFREAAAGLVPYRPTHIYEQDQDGKCQFPLKSIRFGPALDAALSHAAIRLLWSNEAERSHSVMLPEVPDIKKAGYVLR